MELVVASTVMMTALSSMAYVATNAFSDIALARERQTANALLDEAIERLRALPYDTVSLGMRTSDVVGDPRVIGSGTALAPYRLATSNERIVHVSTNQTVEPLVPNVTAKTVDRIVYATRIYLTHFQDNPQSGAVTATAYTDWFSNTRGQGNVFMRTSTVIFSPAAAAAGGSVGACLTTATHPFSGPCVPNLIGSAVATNARTTISSPATTHTVDGPSAASLMQLEQISSIQGSAVSGGVTLDLAGSPSTTGYASGNSKADNDPTPGSTSYDSKPPAGTSPTSAASMTGTFGSSTTTANVAGGATYLTTSATSATASTVCRDTAGTSITDGLPCGRSTGTSGGATSMDAGLDFLGVGLGTMELVQQDGFSVAAHTNRDDASSSTGGGVCTGTSSAGCIHSKATRSIAAYRVGAFPSALKPAGFGYLLELTNYADSVSAEAGIAASAPDAPPPAGTVRYWNGVGYTTVAFAAGVTLPIPTVVATSGTTTIRMTSNLRTGTETRSSTSATCLGTLPCRTRGESMRTSPLTGTVGIEVIVLGVPQLTLTVSVNLGNLTASASYADPPSA